jgi:hypothetical protein
VDKDRNADCVFDVTVTGEPGFAKTYLLGQQIRPGIPTIIEKPAAMQQVDGDRRGPIVAPRP